MAASGGEKSGLGQFVKSQTKYGTATKSTYTNDTFFKYRFEKNETIQGIAVKHGVSVEQIKRANNIWTNESLFLREYLLIPLPMTPSGNPPYPNGSVSAQGISGDQGSSSEDSLEIVTRQELQAACRNSQCKNTERKAPPEASKATKTESTKVDSKQAKEAAFDFLSRMDNSLAQIKTKVSELDSNSQFPEDLSNPLNHLPQRRSSSLYGRRLGSRRSTDSGDGLDPSVEPELAFRTSYSDHPGVEHSRRIQTSLEKLEQRQDDIFQL